MQVRTGDHHEFTPEEAAIDHFVVSPTPARDYAALALLKAQDRYFKEWPEARREAKTFLWTINTEADRLPDRKVNMTLVTNTDGHVDAMERATTATDGLADALRNLGITEADLPAATRAVLRIVKGPGE